MHISMMDTRVRFKEVAGGSPRFVEHFTSSPIYQPYQSLRGDFRIPEFGADSGIENYDHRRSNDDRPPSPELMSPGLESVWDNEGDKEVVVPTPQPDTYQPTKGQPPKRRERRVSAKWIWISLAFLIILALALGVGIGVGLQKRKSSWDSSGALNPQYYSTSGAFNGSGIALASQSFAADLEDGSQGNLVLYFQHHSGEIRWQQLSPSGTWLGGSVSEIVAVDAKNSTPLSAVSYSLNGASTWHLFYIDVNNAVKQRTNSNTTNVWVDGPINQANLVANDADQVGMQACFYGSDYGDSDYTHTPLPGSPGDANYTDEVGMHIWYASDDTTFQQLGWRDGDDSWTHQGNWTDKNGHAGVACYSWGGGTTTYVMFVNLHNTVEFFWKDTNPNLTSTASHPINQWTNSSIAINDVYPATSLGYTNYFYAQMADTLEFNGYNVSWAAENSSLVAADDFTVGGAPGVPGTHLSVSAIPDFSGGNQIVVFYQTNGSDITEYSRDLVEGQWAMVDVPIPQS